jgi:glycolate oxidase
VVDSTLINELERRVGTGRVSHGAGINDDDLHDESLHRRPRVPMAVVRPRSTAEVVEIARFASEHQIPIVPRGSGTGLSGGATPVTGGLVVSFSDMNAVLRIDDRDHVAVVQPGITLRELDEALAASDLRYPVYPGEMSASLGGNVNTNAGGMRAVRHGVTRQHVLGLELVLMDGTVLRTGGSVVKSSSGYDLTQLVVGSEGTLAMVTEITLRLSPRLDHGATILVPFATLDQVTNVVSPILSSGLAPSILEYVDLVAMSSITARMGLDLGIAKDVAAATLAYLVIVLETRTREQLDGDIETLGELLADAGALETYVLPSAAATRLIEAREQLFWSSKEAGANDIIDIVVPRSAVPQFLADATAIAQRYGVFFAGCGHVGDGNVHLSVLENDEAKRNQFLDELFAYGVGLGGAISGEHGIGLDKKAAFLALSDPVSLALQRSIKSVFDPQGLLNPYRLLDERELP